MDVDTAERVGSVAACTVAASPARVTGLILKTRGRGSHTLDWKDVASFGKDAVAIHGADRIRVGKDIERDDPSHGSHDPVGKPVLTETGMDKGTVLDLEFDERTGRIDHVVTTGERIPGDALLGAGSYAVVVSAPD
ncbi:PRC-barrel domain-containing protein [Streptomyces sp. NPDC048389]|uniref:PRC-barrel domain-containing protein n=1 Tax=Streptomyces sp. NPDC048389 TaxID=3154622 RepID=UPI00345525E4